MQGICVTELVEIVIYLIVCIGIGVYCGKKTHSSEQEYWVAAASRTVLGARSQYARSSVRPPPLWVRPALHIRPPAVMCVALGFPLQFPLIVHITASPLLEKNICTLGDFFQDRIGGRHVRWLYAILSLIFMVAYVVPNMKASALVGMWAVTITDIIQGVVMMIGVVGLALAIILNCGEFGGLSDLPEAAVAARPAIAQMGYVPIAALGLAMIWGLWGLVAPMTVMRVLTMRNGKSACRSLILGSIFAAVTVIVAGFVAAVAATIDPELANADMSYIVTMERYFPPVVTGFFVAAIFAALMSSVDSFLLSASSSVAHDIYKCLIDPQTSEQTVIRLGAISLIVIGLITTGISCLELPLISVLAGWAAGALISAFCAPLVIGLYWKGISRNGVFWSMLIGAVGYIFLNRWPAFPAMGEVIVMVPLTAIICYVVSKLSPDKEKQ